MSHRSSSVEQIYIAMSDFVTSFIYLFILCIWSTEKSELT